MKNIIKFTCLSFVIWAIPFFLRLFITSKTFVLKTLNEAYLSTNSSILEENLYENLESFDIFLQIFKTNISSCFINIFGGFVLGLSTISNLVINGFMMSDTFYNAKKMGLPFAKILQTTLPHSIELIGLWLSGGIGLEIAYRMYKIIRGREDDTLFSKEILFLSVLVFIIILAAAYIEAYISFDIAKHV